MKPGRIELTEEAVLNPAALPEYMQGCRRFRIEYRCPETGFSNFEGIVYLPNVPNVFDVTDAIKQILEKAWRIVR